MRRAVHKEGDGREGRTGLPAIQHGDRVGYDPAMRLIAFALFLAALQACAAEPVAPAADLLDRPVTEFCTTQPGDAFGDPGLHWECSGLSAPTLRALESMVLLTHRVQAASGGLTAYESGDDVWVFYRDGTAVRFHRLMEGDAWKGVGVAFFCADNAERCAKLRIGTMRMRVPPPAMSVVGPR